MSSPVHLDNEQSHLIQPVSWLILFGYLLLSLTTFILVQFVPFATRLFSQTELIILINAVWFSLGIVLYGIYALIKNWRRIKLSHLNVKLDTQFLIVVAFLFFGLNQVIDLMVFLEVFDNAKYSTSMNNTGKVLEFGGFMSGLASIYLGRKRFE